MDLYRPLRGLRGKKRTASGITSFILVILFLLFTGPYTKFLLHNVLYPLGLLKINDLLGITIALILVALPPSVSMYVSMGCLLHTGDPILPHKDRFLKQITELDSARANLSRAIAYLDDMKEEINANHHKQEELSSVVEKLESVSKESAAELRKKLEAIGLVNKWKEVNKILIGFFLGIIASLIATAIWTVVVQNIVRSTHP